MQIRRILTIFAFLMPICVLTSCFDDEKLDFSVNVQGYILQSDSAGEQHFTPIIMASSNYYEFPLHSVELYSSKANIKMTRYSDYTYMTDMTSVFKSLDLLNGEYTLVAKATTGEAKTSSTFINYNFTAADTVAAINVIDFSYKGQSILATLTKTAGAEVYGFQITPYNEGTTPPAIDHYFFPIVYSPAADTVKLGMLFPKEERLSTKYADIRIYCSSPSGIIRESTEVVSISK